MNLDFWATNTLFENYQKCLIWLFQFWHFKSFLFKSDLSGNTVWPQASGFEKLAKIIFQLTFVHVNIASLAILNETFAVIFKHSD